MSYNHANEPKSMKKDSKAADTRNVMVMVIYACAIYYCMHNTCMKGKGCLQEA